MSFPVQLEFALRAVIFFKAPYDANSDEVENNMADRLTGARSRQHLRSQARMPTCDQLEISPNCPRRERKLEIPISQSGAVQLKSEMSSCFTSRALVWCYWIRNEL